MNQEIIIQARQSVGLFIKELRNDRGYTQQQLADKIGVTHATVNKIEQGKFNYGIDLLFKISIALGFRYEFQTKDMSENPGRFDLFTTGNEAVIIDNLHGIRLLFEIGNFNDSQQVEFESKKSISPGNLATAMREIGDWISKNHPELL